MNPPEEFDVRLGDLPPSLKDEATRESGNYSIPLILNWSFIGSGTLVKLGRLHGILTAEHVVNPPCKDLRLNCSPGSEQRLRTSIADHAHEIGIEARYLQIRCTQRRNDESGPDLAFIHIPEGPFLSAVSAKKSFANLSDFKSRFAAVQDDNGFIVATGYPEVERFQGSPQHGFGTVEGLMGYGFFTGQLSYENRGEHDFIEVGASYESYEGETVPATFAGVSGGGIWRMPIFRKAGAAPGSEYYSRLNLAGVVFYQTETKANYRRLRAHGPVSLYKTFLPQVMAELGG